MAKKKSTTEGTEAPVVEEKAPKISQNGIVQPGAGSTTGRIWDISNDLSAAAGAPAKRADVLKACQEEGINASTAATQYGRWRKFHGLGKEVKEAAPESAPAEA